MKDVCNGFGLQGILTTDCDSYCQDFCIWDFNLSSSCASDSCRDVLSENGNHCKVHCLSFPARYDFEIFVPSMENVPATIEGIGVMKMPSYFDRVAIHPSTLEDEEKPKLVILDNAFKDASALQVFEMDNVNLEDIPENALPASLVSLWVRSVPMGKLPKVLNTLTNLTSLELVECDLEQFKLPSNVNTLKYLDVSYNQISQFNESLPTLRDIDLDSTGLTQIPKSIYSIPNLRSIGFMGNFAAGTSLHQIIPNSTYEEREFLLRIILDLGDAPIDDCCMLTRIHGTAASYRNFHIVAQCTTGQSFFDECHIARTSPPTRYDGYQPYTGDTDIPFVLASLMFLLAFFCVAVIVQYIYNWYILRCDRFERHRIALGLNQTRDTLTDVDDQTMYVEERSETFETRYGLDPLSPFRIPYEDVVFSKKISVKAKKKVWECLYLNQQARVMELRCLQDVDHITALHQKVANLCKIQHEFLSSIYGVAYYSSNRLFLVFENPKAPNLTSQLLQGTNTWDTRKNTIALQIGRAIEYLHSTNSSTSHNIRSANIFISTNDNVKLRHPIFQYEQEANQDEDIYNFGIVLYELATNQLYSRDSIENVKFTLSNKVDCPIHIQQLILDCLTQTVKIHRIVGILDQNICSILG